MKNTLDKVLEHYENKTQTIINTESISDNTMSEAHYELWEYLCGDRDIRHLYNYYDLIDGEK
jgi:hypothetical protein